MSTKPATVHLSVESDSVSMLLNTLDAAIRKAPKDKQRSAEQFFKRFFSVVDPFEQLTRVELGGSPTGATKVVMTLYPGNIFLMFARTILAGDFNFSAVEQAHSDSFRGDENSDCSSAGQIPPGAE